MLPLVTEQMIADQLRYADLVLYPISPSTAIPATYPMLDTDPSVWKDPDPDPKMLGILP